MVTITKVAPKLYTFNNFSLFVNIRTSRLPLPFWNFSHLCQEVTVSTFQKPTGLPVTFCDVNKIVIFLLKTFFVDTF